MCDDEYVMMSMWWWVCDGEYVMMRDEWCAPDIWLIKNKIEMSYAPQTYMPYFKSNEKETFQRMYSEYAIVNML